MEAKKLFGNDAQMIGVYGSIGAGKTHLAATISEHWNDGKPAALDDLFVFETDLGGLKGLTSKGITAPNINLFDMIRRKEAWAAAGFSSEPGPLEITNYTIAQIRERVKKGQTKIVIIDTLSNLDRVVMYHLQVHGVRDMSGGRVNFNNKALFGKLGQIHTMLFVELARLNVPCVLCMHQKALEADTDEGAFKSATTGVQTATLQTTSGPSNAQIGKVYDFNLVPALAGNVSSQIWKSNMLMEMYVEDLGTQGHIVYTKHAGAETKNRLDTLAPKSFKNETLRSICNKLSEACEHGSV